MADLDIEARDPNALIGAARRALTVSIAQSGGTIDFMDMLYMPILTDGTTFPRTDLAMVDELQDLDPLQRRMVEMVGAESGGFIGVGDPRQAIFSWRGTGLDAMERVARTMECAALPLSVCYRCPTSHLDLAREYVPQIEAAPGAIAGLVEEHAVIDPARFAAGDVIICRMKAPCVDLAIRLIQAGIPTRVLGRDIAASIEELVRSSGAETVTALVQAARKRCARAEARATTLGDDRALAEAADRQRIVEAIADTLNNTNEHFSTQLVSVGSVLMDEWAISGGARYRPDEVTLSWTSAPGVTYYPAPTDGRNWMGSQGFFASNSNNYVFLSTPSGTSGNFWVYSFTRSTQESQVLTSSPGKITAGGDMAISANTLNNDNSHILASGNLAGSFGTVTRESRLARVGLRIGCSGSGTVTAPVKGIGAQPRAAGFTGGQPFSESSEAFLMT
jgi:hypothetical protein